LKIKRTIGLLSGLRIKPETAKCQIAQTPFLVHRHFWSWTVPGKMEASDDGEAEIDQSNVKRREKLVRWAAKDPAAQVIKAARERREMPDTISERGLSKHLDTCSCRFGWKMHKTHIAHDCEFCVDVISS